MPLAQRPLAIQSLAAFAAFLLPQFLAAGGELIGSEVIARIDREGGGAWYGKLEAKGDLLSVVTENNERHEIDLASIERVEVASPRVVWNAEKLESGPLATPWSHAIVGELPHGGSADVQGGNIAVATSSPTKESGFEAFSMAYRPLPDGDAQITAMVALLDTYQETAKGGVMLRDGTGVDARNIFLSLSHREPATFRNWKGQGGTSIVDRREGIRPGNWLRLVRAGGKISGYVSNDGAYWREIATADDEFEGAVYACLVSKGTTPRRRWSTVFENVDVTTLDVLGHLRLVRPKFVLIDGTVFHGEIESATPQLFKLGGRQSGRVLPALTVARIEFFRPIPHDRRHYFSGGRPGVLLANGDFFESKLAAIDGAELATSSALFGKRRFDLVGNIDGLVMRAAPEDPSAKLPYRVDTWAGGKLAGKAIHIADGELVIDTIRLGAASIPLAELRTIQRQ